jgi:OmpA-OmpF porin, OOP family
MIRRIALLLGLLLGSAARADSSEPKADLPGAKDSPLIGRFAGSFIVSREQRDFDELKLPLAALKQVADKEQRDRHNNLVFEPGRALAVEGRRTRLVYLLPAGVAPLQAARNYQNDAEAKGGKTLWECKDAECGGDAGRASEGGGGEQSLAMYLRPEEEVKDKEFTNGNCAQTQRISGQRYAVLDLPRGNAVASVLAYAGKGGSYCKTFTDRTVVVVDLVERKAMEQKMVTLKAEEMQQAITASGRVALYGIYFDSGKAEVKPESKDTLEQIARLLSSDRTLKLLVVGHTDDVGGFAPNLELSRRRAEAVIAALAGTYKVDRKRLTPFGVSYASPIAPNTGDEGRAKNRRVELVPGG